MNSTAYDIYLGLVVVWPLLLAIPALQERLPKPCYLAIAPAMVLILLPDEAFLAPPWLLFGVGFVMNNDIRWILAMSVTIWIAAASFPQNKRQTHVHDYSNPLFMLTLAGNLGTVLSADLVAFFCCSTLMGYGFYGLMVQGREDAARHAGRLYLVFLVIADLILFEAILLAAFTHTSLQFTELSQVMSGDNASQVYLWMVSAGFVLKAGLWPAHLWLTTSFRSIPPPAALLLGGVPVAMAVLGLVRWLPLGVFPVSSLGTLLQALGIIAVLYAAVMLNRQRYRQIISGWCVVTATGLFSVFIGTGLANPELWNQYRVLVYPFIAAPGVLAAVLVITFSRQERLRQPATDTTTQVYPVVAWVDARHRSFLELLKKIGTLPRQGVTLLNSLRRWQGLLDTSERQLQRWPLAITLLVMLAMAVVLLAFAF